MTDLGGDWEQFYPRYTLGLLASLGVERPQGAQVALLLDTA